MLVMWMCSVERSTSRVCVRIGYVLNPNTGSVVGFENSTLYTTGRG